MEPLSGGWEHIQNHSARLYTCGHCGSSVASEKGWRCLVTGAAAETFVIRVCPYCRRPTYFESAAQIPGIAVGEPVKHVPQQVEALYNEARTASAASAHTAAVLSARKLLMHIAVDRG